MNGNINKVNNCQFTEIYFINCCIKQKQVDKHTQTKNK